MNETGSSQGCKQCDMLLRYCSEGKNEVVVGFLQTLFIGHAKGKDVANQIVDILRGLGYQLPLWTKREQNYIEFDQHCS